MFLIFVDIEARLWGGPVSVGRCGKQTVERNGKLLKIAPRADWGYV